MADFVPEEVPRPQPPAAVEDDDDEDVEVVQCECWWTLKDETWGDGERVDYADYDCPVHTREDDEPTERNCSAGPAPAATTRTAEAQPS